MGGNIEWDKHPDLDEWYSKDRGLWDVGDYVISPHSEVEDAWQIVVRGHRLDEPYAHWKLAMQDCQRDADLRAGIRPLTQEQDQ